MKRRSYLLPLMAVTTLSFSLAACDDNKSDNAADDTAIVAPETAPVAESSIPAVTAEPIRADMATAYATAEGVRTGAVFVRLNNPNADSDKLISAMTDKATMVEIHEGFVDEADGTMQMRKVDGVEIPAGQEVTLKPGGYHIMLIDLVAPLIEGDTFNIALQFQNAGQLMVPVTVVAPGALSDNTTHNHDSMTSGDGSTGTDIPVLEDTTATDEPMTDTTLSTDTVDEVPADPVTTDAPAGNEQPAQ